MTLAFGTNYRITQGAFSFLPDLTDAQIQKQIAYAISKGWSVAIESTPYPHPRNSYWEMWGLPLFDIQDPSVAMYEIDRCRAARKNQYTRIMCYDNTRGVESCALSFMIDRPDEEVTFSLIRQEATGRRLVYTLS